MIGSERQSALTYATVEELLKKRLVDPPSREALFQKVREGFSQFLREWEAIHKEAEHKIRSMKRGVLPGSSEWDVLYLQFFEEKYKKSGGKLLLKDRTPSKTS